MMMRTISSLRAGLRAGASTMALVLLLSACASRQGDAPPPLTLDHLSLAAPKGGAEGTAPKPVTSHSSPAPVIVKGSRPPVPVGADELAVPPGPALHLRFTDAPLALVVDTVLGDMLGMAHSISPALLGTVSIDSGRELSPREALRLLENVLAGQGAVLVRGGDGTLAVLPQAEAAGNARTLGLASPSAPGLAVSVLPLRHIAPDVAQGLVAPLVKNGTVTADPRLGLLLVSGPAPERQAAADLLRGFDVDWMAGRSAGLFPLTQASPAPLVRELEAILGAQGDADPSLRLLPVERLNAVLVIASDAARLETAAGWVRRLDGGDMDTARLRIFSLTHADATRVAKLLNRLFTGAATDATAPTMKAMPLPSVNSSSGTGTSSTASGNSTAMADNAARLSAISADAGGAAPPEPTPGSGDDTPRIIPDPANNSILVHAKPRQAEIIGEAVAKLDVAPSQVLIEATIAEVTLNDQLRYGVQSYFRGDGGDVQGGFTLNSTSSSLRPISKVPGFNLVLSSNGDPRVVLSALDQVTDVRVISSPQVVVLDSQVAQLLVGDRVPVLTRTTQSVDNANSPIVSSVDYVNTGVILRVVPRISQSGKVTMEVYQEISNVSGTRNSGNLTPTISQRQITSNVAVDSGQTVVLGGLISETQESGRDGIPLLSSLPGVGALFGEKRSTKTRTELIVFITPRVIRDEHEAEAVTAELMTRLKGIQPLR
ncbi:type II secretion system protein GspD [Niveispirillum sp. SYP-B3756]|uniref:type II secretion system secretin GspD n=1 Tax=Niveispirillum sp. SYP-B3756 TaxID=2662178 RepID=UPI001290DDD5|nr:type II secretion system secretin GspD [Niveispirillum sp. SYP-B3756]MQP68104.1 type II secretion system protein GspD [Niveispirillum sp. SYP-B3756]